MRLPCYSERVARRQPDGSEQAPSLAFGSVTVHLPGERALLTLVMIQGFGEEPLQLLTNLKLPKRRKALWWVVEAYLTRWRTEDGASPSRATPWRTCAC
jgi:hypothetical protein